MPIKQFEVDWDDYSSVVALGSKIKSRLGELNPNRVSKNEKTRLTIDYCKRIYDTDISPVYLDTYDTEKKYYVYAHLDTSKAIAIGRHGITTFGATLGMTHFPFYIGKGTGDRYLDFNRNETHRKVKQKLAALDKEPKAIIIMDDMDEKQALMLESKLIDIFGLVARGGYLVNLDEGLNKDERRVLYREHFNQLRSINRML